MFRWYGYPTAGVGDDIDVATDAFMTAITPVGRVWNPWSGAMVREEFRDRIVAAERGELEPIDEVKSVDEENPPPLYEIRWQGISVTDIQNGVQRHGTILVRLYHSEPEVLPRHFIGHQIHEKNVETDDVYGAQDAEIAIAKRYYDAGERIAWGVAEA